MSHESRLRFGPLVACLLLGGAGSSACNAVLGIDAASYDAALDPPAPGAGGSAGGNGSGAAGAGGARLLGDPICLAFCTNVMQVCTDSLQAYPSVETCQAMCEQLDDGPERDLSKNTVQCRQNHAALAVTDTDNKTVHCLAAGPLGNGVCGDPCAAFCALNQAWCAPPQIAAAIYPNADECITACKSFPFVDRPQSSFFTVDEENNLNCRDYHLQVAYQNLDSATKHCSHIAPKSVTCN